MVKKQIQDLILKERKARNTKTAAFLGTVVTEMTLQESRDPKKYDELKVIKKMRDDAITCGNSEESTFFEQFLPKLMDEGQIYEALAALDVENNNLGSFMKAWNMKPELKGKADMGLVRKLITETYLS